MYALEFSPVCLKKLEKINDVFRIHEVLGQFYVSVRQNPRAFDIVPPLGELYYFRTVAYQRGDLEIPVLTFFFKILEDDRIVKIIDVRYKNKAGEWE